MKKIFLMPVLFASLLFMACGSDDDNNPPMPTDPEEIIKDIDKMPYSELSPEQQKVKLEADANELIKYGDAAKNSVSIEAMQTLESLLSTSSVSIVTNGIGRQGTITNVQETVQYADVYGVYTWNRTKKDWDKTASTSELKFVFPAKKNGTANNASFTITATSSGIPVVLESKDCDWYYDEGEGEWDEDCTITETTYYLPSKAKGLIAIDGREAGAVDFSADYQGNKEVPVKSDFSISLSDGYKLVTSWEKGANNTATTQMTYNNAVLFDAAVKANVKLDDIFDKLDAGVEVPYNLYGNSAEGYIKVLDNLVFVVKVDAAAFAQEMAALDDLYEQKWDDLYESSMNPALVPEWGGEAHEMNTNKDYYTTGNQYRKEYSEKQVALYNKHLTMTLASSKDGAKIADVVWKSEKSDYGWVSDYEYWDETKGYWWSAYPTPTGVTFASFEYYGENYYFKFKDNSTVEVDAYFSTGFSTFIKNWEDFVKAFDR